MLLDPDRMTGCGEADGGEGVLAAEAAEAVAETPRKSRRSIVMAPMMMSSR